MIGGYAVSFVSRSCETLSRRLPCPGHTERGSRRHYIFALARTVRTLHADSDGVAVGEETTAWRGPGGPSPAERGGRVCSEKSERTRHLGDGWGRASARAHWLPLGGGKKLAR